MTRVAYFDLANGISGDMTLAALVHAGRKLGIVVETAITDAISSLNLGCSVEFVDDERGGLACVRTKVKTPDKHLTSDDLRTALPGSAALEALIDAERTVHGTDDVHLHELGSPDTAVDLAGAAAGLQALDITEVFAARVPMPTGWIRAGHGDLPLPAPVTLELLRGVAVTGVDSDFELVTPTGAAILVGHGATFGPMPSFVLEAVGVGAGSKETAKPNITRVLVGTRTANPTTPAIDTAVLLETNIDDQTPQGVAYAADLLLQEGALDAWITPIVMKKSRPGFLLSALVNPADEQRLCDVILRNTTTLGVRRRVTDRWVTEREVVRVTVHGEPVNVKIAKVGDDVTNVAPEYDDCVRVAQKTGLALHEVQAEATAAYRRVVDSSPRRNEAET